MIPPPRISPSLGLACSFAALLSCGSGGGSIYGTVPNIPVGHWKSDCLDQPSNGISTFDIRETEWSVDFQRFNLPGCVGPMFTMHTEGGYHLGDPSGVDGSNKARFAFSKRTITPHDPGAIVFLVTVAGCKDVSFKVGVETDLSDKSCPTFGIKPISTCSADHDLVARDGDRLSFGARPQDNNMCSEDKRPSALASWAAHRVN